MYMSQPRPHTGKRRKIIRRRRRGPKIGPENWDDRFYVVDS